MLFISRFSLVGFIIVCISACTPSKHPVYDEKTLVFDRGLLGEWRPRDGEPEEYIQFQRRDENSYFMLTEDGGEIVTLVAHLADIGKYRYIDLCFYEPFDQDEELTVYHADHIFFRIERRLDKLHFQILDDTWIEEKLKSGNIELQHELHDHLWDSPDKQKMVRITATTEEIQKFLIENEDYQDLFYSDEGPFYRVNTDSLNRRGKPVRR